MAERRQRRNTVTFEMPEINIPKLVLNSMYGVQNAAVHPNIKRVIFNDPATIILWDDDTKTVVKCQEGDTYSKELGFAMCVTKKFFGNKGNFNEVFKKYVFEKG